MSEFNNYNNQTPPDNNSRPDYSYNWNGSEHGNNSGGKGGKILSIIAIIFGIIAIVTVCVYLANIDISGMYNDNSSSMPDESAGGHLSAPPENESSGGNLPVPDFEIAGDAQIDLSTDLSKIYEACSPSCCTIEVSVRGSLYSIGSGFVIDSENGYIATNHHVIESGDSIKVVFYDGKSYDAKLINSDSTTDIAILKIEAEGLKAVQFGSSDNIKVGEGVIAIGTPYSQNLAGTMTYGIVSGIARDIEITNDSGKVIKTMTLIQTDCSINPGNSGGPLIDMAGNVIGITSMKLVDEQFEGIGFAIPITNAIEIFRQLIAGESIGGGGFAEAEPQIGITVTTVEDGLYYYLRTVPKCEYPAEGVFVASINADSSAYAAGLNYYDIIVEFNGESVNGIDALGEKLENHKAGDSVEIKVFRFNRTFTSGEYQTITFTLDAAN